MKARRVKKLEEAGAKVELNFASSSTLARQIAEGAPADVFASASAKTMDTVVTALALRANTGPLAAAMGAQIDVGHRAPVAVAGSVQVPGVLPFVQPGHLVQEELDEDVSAILGYYQLHGWVAAKVNRPVVTEGSKTTSTYTQTCTSA